MQTKVERRDNDSSSIDSDQEVRPGKLSAQIQPSDLRPLAIAQRQYRENAHAGSRMDAQRKAAETVQRKSANADARQNRTGLPDRLKAGIESLSGISMDGVKVRYNSPQPAQLHAHAYAQGNEIHIAPGQERHLPHEAWHVVQQAQGRVSPTIQLKGDTQINDDKDLETEADIMGAKAAQFEQSTADGLPSGSRDTVLQQSASIAREIVQREVDPDFTTFLAGRALSKAEMQDFYDRYVANEVRRLNAKYIDDDAKVAMKNAETYFTLFMLNSSDPAAIQAKLDALVVAVNTAAASLDAIIRVRGSTAGTEDAFRDERERREGAKHYAGTTKEMELRGVKSRTEAEAILTGLHNAITGAIGNGYALGHVGVRGSAVTGIRTRTGTPFEEGVGAFQNASDASDLDFFFTSPDLETRIRATQHHLPEARRINAGGTMNAQYLARWLNLGAARNGYAASQALLTALGTFQTNTQSLIGRKSEVTFVGGDAAANLMTDPGTLIR